LPASRKAELRPLADEFMFYEIRITLKTLREEGWGSFMDKLRVYFTDLAAASVFFRAQRPNDEPPAVVDFVWNAGKGLIAPAQVKSELSELLNWMHQRKPPETVLEIGTARGGTLFCWCAMADTKATVISLDLPQGIHGGGYPYWKTFIYRRFKKGRQKMSLLRGDSHMPEMLNEVKRILADRQLDFLFIDGDHTLAGVRSDYEMYSPLVKSGGFIVFHDICKHPAAMNCHVDEYWSEIKTKGKWLEFVKDPAQGAFGIGVLLVD
jgi:predicted O-methyltransferase YrrM